jgi:hypothetical protein
MPKLIDLSGQRFGRLVVIERCGTRNTHPEWLCKCDCGKQHKVTTNQLKRGTTKSCGCYGHEWLMLGPHQAACVPRPRVVEITYPIPPNTEPILARRYQWRWERVERQITYGYPEPSRKQGQWFFTDEDGHRVVPIDLEKLAAQKRVNSQLIRHEVSEVPSSFRVGASISDRIRVVSAEELARL